jgi:hypothetical protein
MWNPKNELNKMFDNIHFRIFSFNQRTATIEKKVALFSTTLV